MNEPLVDTLHVALNAIEVLTVRVNKLEKVIQSLDSKMKDNKSYLETKIESTVSTALKDVLDNIVIQNTTNIPESNISVDTSALAKEVSKLVNINPITVEASPVTIELDTEGLITKLDNKTILDGIVKLIAESSKETRVLLKEMINSKEVVVESEPEDIESPVKSINIIRGQDNLIQSLEIIRE